MSDCALCVQDVVHVCNNCVALMFSQMDCSEVKSSVIICWGRCELKTAGSVVSWWYFTQSQNILVHVSTMKKKYRANIMHIETNLF